MHIGQCTHWRMPGLAAGACWRVISASRAGVVPRPDHAVSYHVDKRVGQSVDKCSHNAPDIVT